MSEPEIKIIDEQTVAYVTMHGAYSQTPQGYSLLYGWIAQHGLVPTGMPGAVYLTMPDETLESGAVWELWAPVAGQPAESEPDTSGVGVKRIECTTVASAMHRGPYETVTPTYEALWAWIEANGYVASGPPMELYYSDPADTPPEEYLTEIRIPIASRSTGAGA